MSLTMTSMLMNERSPLMKKQVFIVLTLIAIAMSGCSTRTGSAAAGAVAGAAGGAGAYEYKMNRELNRLEEEYKAGQMDQREYEIRKDQTMRMMLTK
jgi:outer membrane lipoprotein SlyB